MTPLTPWASTGRRAGQRQVEDLIGLLARHGGLVDRAELVVRFEGRERLSERFGILGGEERALDGAAIAQVLQDLLADQLALAVAIGGEDDLITRFERCRDRLEFDRLVAFGCRPGGVEPVRFQ
jgi:hypothetical protein